MIDSSYTRVRRQQRSVRSFTTSEMLQAWSPSTIELLDEIIMSIKPEPPRSPIDGSAPRGEVLVAHDPNAGDVTEVRNLVVQSSITELKQHGFYERYQKCIAPDALEDLLSRVAPGWIPVELVIAHYQACEDMNLSNEELNSMGSSVGDRLQSAT